MISVLIFSCRQRLRPTIQRYLPVSVNLRNRGPKIRNSDRSLINFVFDIVACEACNLDKSVEMTGKSFLSGEQKAWIHLKDFKQDLAAGFNFQKPFLAELLIATVTAEGNRIETTRTRYKYCAHVGPRKNGTPSQQINEVLQKVVHL